jgi:large subunit ribosomal protein L24
MQATKNPGKQRKLLFNAPAHLRHKIMSAPLSPELVKSRGAKTLPVRKGDAIRIMRGDHEGFEGKIQRLDLSEYRIYVEGLTREKVDGTAIFVSVHPSKVMIINLSLDDKWRKEILQRKRELPAKEEKVAKKAAKKAVEVVEEKPLEAKAEVQAKPAKKKTKVVAKKKVEKLAAKKQKEPKPKPALVEPEKPVKKKVKAPAKKAPAKRKSTKRKEGGA